ncbi:MAG: hypothetical protein EPO26_08055 [Chloroflexota bacterium]|nr:MAG: hypothetical protein EPO26_08055 [Chloroflexota bacterium]
MTRISRDEFAECQRDLRDRLAGVRAEFEEALAHYSVRVQGELARIGDAVSDSSNSSDASERARRAEVIREATRAIRELRLKPERGRRRDLRTVEELAKDLTERIADW